MKSQQDERLGTEKMGKLVWSMVLPAVAAQLINVLYNIVDRVYIGRIEGYGDLALTGVGLAFPVVMIIAAFSAFAGMGGAPLASMKLGKQDYKGAEKILGNCMALLMLFSVILTIFFAIYKTPILYMFGASENTITYADQYVTIYLIGTIFVQVALGLNTFISAQGNAKIAMLSVCLGAGINIILDPIFIFVLDMGVSGAALATIISQACSAIWVLWFLISKRSIIQLKRKYVRFNKNIILSIGALGISPFIMQSTESLVSITLNSGLQSYGGDIYVGAMSILTSVMQLIFIPANGISQGIQPIISYNYGAGNHDRVLAAFKRLILMCSTYTIILGSIAIFAPQVLVALFTNSEELFNTTVEIMPIFCLGTVTIGVLLACQGTFLAVGQAKISIIIALLRKVILLIPLAIILPRFHGVMGIYYAEPIADITSAIVAAILFALFFKKILRK